MQKNLVKKKALNLKKRSGPRIGVARVIKGKTVYIGNLLYKIDEKSLFGLFGRFGKVNQVKIIKNPGGDQSKGIAFVEMLKESDADNAIESLNGRVIGGRTVKVSEAIDNAIVARTVPMKQGCVEREKKEEEVDIFDKEAITQNRLKRRRRGSKSTALEEMFRSIGKKQ